MFRVQFFPASTRSDDECVGATDITLDDNNQWTEGWFTCTYTSNGPTEACIGGDGQFTRECQAHAAPGHSAVQRCDHRGDKAAENPH